MLSRVADSIFWMSRYIERAENVARFVDVNLNLAIELGPEAADQWAALVFTTGDYAAFAARHGEPNRHYVLQFLTFDEENANSILSCVRRARENARQVREMIADTLWEEVNKFYLMVRDAAGDERLRGEPMEFFARVRLASQLIEGITEATMSHGEAWHFRRMGRLVERADKTSRILDVKYYLLQTSAQDGGPLDTVQWSALLKSASALEMYRQKHGRITPHNVADFLLLDRDFPRAAHFCLLRAEQSLLAITGGSPGTYRNLAEQRMGRLRSELDYANIREILAGDLHEFVDAFQTKLNGVGDAIYETFFAMRPLHPSEPESAANGHAASAVAKRPRWALDPA